METTISLPSKSHSLPVFFALAFGLSWLVWIPTALAAYGLIPFSADPTLSGLLGAFGPTLAALITTAFYDGKAGFRMLLNRLLTWRVGLRWYLFVLFWPALLSLLKTGIAMMLGSALPDFSRPLFVQLYPLPPELLNTTPFLVFLPFIFLQQMLLGSSMGEELGWRGYALPRLQDRHSSARASLILGLTWSVWHFPLWLTQGHAMQGTFLLWPVLDLLATTLLFTWVYNHTQGSLLLALLFHTSIAVTGLFLASADAHPLIGVAINGCMALLILVRFGPQRLAREPERV